MSAFQSFTHSYSLPLMSHKPNRFSGIGVVHPSRLIPFAFSAVHATSPETLPPANCVSFPARAAYSHSASVGMRYPVQS